MHLLLLHGAKDGSCELLGGRVTAHVAGAGLAVWLSVT
jgi:hypothetical protein